MTIKKRTVVMGIVAFIVLILYVTVKFNSQVLVEHVVEQALIQKVPAGIDPVKVRQRFQELLAAEPDRRSRTDFLFRIAADLEKVQQLSRQKLAAIVKVKNLEEFKR